MRKIAILALLIVSLPCLAQESSTQKQILEQSTEQIGPEAFAQPVPTKLQKQAKNEFAQGKSYFVWSEQEVPVKSQGSQTVVPFPLKYSPNPATKAPPFAVFVVITVNSEGRAAEVSHGIDGYKKYKNGKEEWQATGMLFLLGESLYGNGEAKIFLVQRDDFRKRRAEKTLPIPEPISNIVTLPIILE
jgi:hypothetical protein